MAIFLNLADKPPPYQCWECGFVALDLPEALVHDCPKPGTPTTWQTWTGVVLSFAISLLTLGCLFSGCQP